MPRRIFQVGKQGFGVFHVSVSYSLVSFPSWRCLHSHGEYASSSAGIVLGVKAQRDCIQYELVQGS